jgi:hypothetical protein
VPVEGVPHEIVDLSDTRAAEAAVARGQRALQALGLLRAALRSATTFCAEGRSPTSLR